VGNVAFYIAGTKENLTLFGGNHGGDQVCEKNFVGILGRASGGRCEPADGRPHTSRMQDGARSNFGASLRSLCRWRADCFCWSPAAVPNVSWWRSSNRFPSLPRRKLRCTPRPPLVKRRPRAPACDPLALRR
jgi:hypothetical protein